MAKRKRLISAALIGGSDDQGTSPLPAATASPRRPPIAQVAGETAATAALQELASEMKAARSEGRLVLSLPLQVIKADHLIRDRIVHDDDEMTVLKASLSARGQQTPVEVVELGEDTYGLISGHRRLTALQSLLEETSDDKFATIEALIRPLGSATASYMAMVEENEIRANLSFYERARLAAEAARIGIYPTPARAVAELFANAPAPKRSKITSFLRVHERLGAALKFPAMIPEKLGLDLSKALEVDPGFETRLKDALRKAVDRDFARERGILERCLRGKAKTPPAARDVSPGISLQLRNGQVVLKGRGVTPELVKDLEGWLSQR